ncbi:TonB family protein [Hyphococcus sp.]|uniref:TonB family protein n=1 Tax=Hyphococcus sp. TaxID=2038636 RepID=UPI003751603B
MAQDKSAEIIKFNGPGEAPELDVAPEAVTETAIETDTPAQSLEEAGAGAYLAAARHRAKLSVEQASEATKVKAEHLEAIEWMRLDRLPALPYATGFVKAYARYLGLDPEAVAAQFKIQANAQAALIAPSPAPQTSVSESGEGAKLGSVFAMLAVAIFVLWIGYQVLTGGGRETEVRQAAAPPSATPVETSNIQIAAGPEAASLERVALPPAEPSDAPISDALDTLTEAPLEIAEAASGETAAAPPPEPVAEPVRYETLAPSVSIETPEPSPAQSAPAQPERRERPLPRRARPEPVRTPVIVDASLTRSLAPEYPNGCTRGADAIESVTIIFDVSAEGRAVNSRVVSSTNGCFESEALRTVGRWRFDPRMVDGKAAVEAGKRATLNFKK